MTGDAGTATVLVADDDPDYRLLVRLALDGVPGFAPVLEAGDAEGALAAVAEGAPDVVLLDVALPGAFDVACRLTGLRLVLVSSQAEDELATVAAATGAVGYLGKDLAPTSLPAAIGDVMAVVDRLESLLAKASGRLPADARSARDARHLIGHALAGWCDARQLDDIALCVSELVTNAVLHAGSGPRLLVHVRPTVVHVEISDDSDVLPFVPGAGAGATSGRGVSILGTLSTRWGARRRSGGGKTVWFDMARSGAGAP